VVLYGPKGAGKSWVADQLCRRAGVQHVDADRVVLDLLDRGARPDPRLGWLQQVEAEVRRAVSEHLLVSVEATGAWDSDWMLADRLATAGCQVSRVWVTAPLEVTLLRLAGRRSGKVPVSRVEAEWLYREATRRRQRGPSPPSWTRPEPRTRAGWTSSWHVCPDPHANGSRLRGTAGRRRVHCPPYAVATRRHAHGRQSRQEVSGVDVLWIWVEGCLKGGCHRCPEAGPSRGQDQGERRRRSTRIAI
jgi:gluconate kinase